MFEPKRISNEIRGIKKTYIKNINNKKTKVYKITSISKELRDKLKSKEQYYTAHFENGERPVKIIMSLAYTLAKDDRIDIINDLNSSECIGYTLSNKLLMFTFTNNYKIYITFYAKKRVINVYKDTVQIYHQTYNEEYVKKYIKNIRLSEPPKIDS